MRLNIQDWFQQGKSRLAEVFSHVSQRGFLQRSEPLVLTPKQYKKGITLVLAGAVVIVAGLLVGIYEFVSLQEMKEQNALHEQQLEMMREKTASLQEKMDKMDALDQELRQMVKGAGTGDSPKGDGGVAGQQKKSPDVSHADYNELLHATSRLETKTNARIISFITLKTVLSDTAGQQVREMQQLSKQYQASNYPSIWPVNGTITSNFGYRGNPIGGGTGFHEGVDIAVDYGTPVRVTASGKVTMAGWVDGYGNLVEVDHGGGFVTRYGHNSMLLVVVGQEVKTGDIISLAGSTGRSTGPHVHYEVRVNGTPTDPMLFLP
ncbi:peptidoglycan DD-metalloendopeptidase family protein [Megasphaera hominis]|uniref:Peptidoglycan DD-metalloendopeptidase family protein n=1 Tax=Megasphaera hominis TaxID=159836 RepID=A0ABR6VGF8_9FIRM|nr:peptidoglycan DD-metalloendopeptidase family protein [Megasphaera hominis]